MKRILFFLESLKGGGAEKVLLDIVKMLPKDKYYLKVLVATNNGVYDDEIKDYCDYQSILDTTLYDGNIVQKLLYRFKYKALYQKSPNKIFDEYIGYDWDEVVAFVEGFSTRIVACANSEKVKKVAWVHVDPIGRPYADGYFRSSIEQKEVYQGFHKIVCVSDSVAKSFVKKWGIAESVITQYNPVNREDVIRKSIEIAEIPRYWDFQFVACGRLTKQKGFDRLVSVMKQLKQITNKDFGIIILGEGEERESLSAQIEQSNLTEIVKLLGFKKNPYPYFANSDVFVCSSREEGFSLVVAEAMILGLGIISTNCSGPNELLANGKYGLLVENNEGGLFGAMQKVLEQPNLLHDLQRDALERSEWFDIEKVNVQIQTLIL